MGKIYQIKKRRKEKYGLQTKVSKILVNCAAYVPVMSCIGLAYLLH